MHKVFIAAGINNEGGINTSTVSKPVSSRDGAEALVPSIVHKTPSLTCVGIFELIAIGRLPELKPIIEEVLPHKIERTMTSKVNGLPPMQTQRPDGVGDIGQL